MRPIVEQHVEPYAVLGASRPGLAPNPIGQDRNWRGTAMVEQLVAPIRRR
jgi:hypothetical protein